ncbi:MAG: hypothetical protein GXY88_05865 [Tissierellia bacterium]|nr:hypothetical protein [Tissierellia bacterium]
MYRNILRIMVLILLFSSVIPIVAEARGFVKEIDAEYYKLYLRVEGKKIDSDKEPFIYDNRIWVPLSVLAKGLDLGYKLDGNNKAVYLDSKGRLDPSDNSKEIEAFQKGFLVGAKEAWLDALEGEVLYLERGIERKRAGLDEGEVRNIRICFEDVKVFLDNNRLSFSTDPIFYDGDVYVDIMEISPYLYITPKLDLRYKRIDIDANGVLIDKELYKDMDQLINIRKGRSKWLDIELELWGKRKESIERLGIPFKNINDVNLLEKHLNQYLNKLEDLTFNIEVTRYINNRLGLTFSFPSNRISQWRSLTRKEVEDYIWNVYTAILIMYKDNVSIVGWIRNPYYNKYSKYRPRDYVSFESKDGDLVFDFTNSNLSIGYRVDPDYLAESLNKNLNKYGGTGFEYKAQQRGDGMDLIIIVSSRSFLNSHVYNKMNYLRRLNHEIRRIKPGLTIYGTIIYDEDYERDIKFSIEDNRIRSGDLLKETENYVNGLYSRFSYGRYDFGLRYYIYEKDDNRLDLVVEGDFSIEDEGWISAGTTGLERLKNRVQSAMDYIENLWDMEVVVEVYDENMVEIGISQ